MEDLLNIFQVDDERERMQLIRALMQRKEMLDSVNPLKWDDTDKEGRLDECRGALVRLIRKAKNIKIKKNE